MSENLENSAVAKELDKVSFHFNPKEGQCQRMSNYHTFALIYCATKVMLKILQVRPQQYIDWELPEVQAGFRKGRDQITNIQWMRKTSTSASLTILKHLTIWTTTNWKILKKIGISDHLTCLQRNLYVGQEATVGTGHGTKDWFKIRKGVCQGCILSLWLVIQRKKFF